MGTDKVGNVDVGGWIAVQPDDFREWMSLYLEMQRRLAEIDERSTM